MSKCPHCGQAVPSGLQRGGSCPACGGIGGQAQTQTQTDSTAGDETSLRRLRSLWGQSLVAGAQPTMTLRGQGAGGQARGGLHMRTMQVGKAGDGEAGSPQYVLGQCLGEGGMGVVYEAKQTSLNRTTAVKVLRRDRGDDPGRRERFLYEAAVTAELDHPNIPPVHDLGMDEGGRPFYSMKKVVGRSWQEVIGAKSRTENLNILLNVCNAVAFAHSRGVLHRDLKPANVMLGEFGEVLVMDWGLAASLTGQGPAQPLTAGACTAGTPTYMAPEMAMGQIERIGPASDVYLLGAILHEIVTGKAPHHGRTVLDCLRSAARNRIVPAKGKGELFDIARTAMAAEPADRYAGVEQFQRAIRDYLEHAQSLELTAQADEEARKAAKSKRYDLFAKAISGYEQALRLWPGSGPARAGLGSAHLLYAQAALDRGDVDLAESLLDAEAPAHAELIRKVRAAREGDWIAVYRQDFTSPDADLSGLCFLDNTMVREIDSYPVGLDGMTMERCTFLLFRHVTVRGDVRVEADIVWEKDIDGVEIHLNSQRDPTVGSVAHPRGYYCQFGGYLGTENLIARSDDSSQHNYDTAVPASFEAGQTYRVAFERLGERLEIDVDGKPILQKIDLLPMTGTGLGRVAMRAWGGGVRVLRLAVFRRALPERASPLIAGDALWATGNERGAVQEYEQIARDFRGTPIAEKAMAKAYLAACRIPEDMEAAKARIRSGIGETFPDSPYLTGMLEADCLCAWRAGRHHEAMSFLSRIFQADPQTRVALELLTGAHQPLPAGIGQELLTRVARIRKIGHLDLHNLGLRDLGPLAGASILSLGCAQNRLTSLEPLAGMPLTVLDFPYNKVQDLGPLTGMPLVRLNCSVNHIVDLDPLRGIGIRNLACGRNRIRSLEPLKGMPLAKLDCSCNEISDLGPLRGMGIRTLNVDDNRIDSLEPLSGMPLHFLQCSINPIPSLDPLTGMNLVTLYASCTRISSLAPLQGMPLREIAVRNCRIPSLAPLKGMQLRDVDCQGCGIRSLATLRGMRLSQLLCGRNRISTLRALQGMPLVQLDCSMNRIATLQPLKGMPLAWLACHGNSLRDLRPFEEAPPAYFVFDTEALPDSYVDGVLQRWEAAEKHVDLARHCRAARAVRQGDMPAARSLAASFGGHRYLRIHAAEVWEEACGRARDVGGHLVTITSPEEHKFVLSLLPRGDVGTWLGLTRGKDGDVWVTGEPVIYKAYLSDRDADTDLPRLMVSHVPQWHAAISPDDPSQYIIEWDD
jgi:Leucine-rich repeat (LRR) protein